MSDVIVELTERPDSRRFTKDPPSGEYKFTVAGEFDDQTAYGIVALGTPPMIETAVGNLFRNNIQIEPDGWKLYVATVTYGPQQNDTGEVTFAFDTTGGTTTAKAGIEHIASYPASDSNPNPFKGFINVGQDGTVNGVEMLIPALKLSYTFKHPQGVVTTEFVKTLAAATGKTNLNPFLGYEAGELLFTGASGSDGTNAEADVTYNMVASANATGLQIGDITGIDKGGHDVLWIEPEDTVSDGQASVQPKRVHIDRVYDRIDFAEVFGWS